MKAHRLLSSLIVAAGVATAAGPALALQPLEEFLGHASGTAFDVRESIATGNQREAESGVALSRLAPAVGARGTYTRNQYEVRARFPGSPSELVITPFNQLDAAVQVEVPILDLSSYHRYRAATATARAQRATTDAVRLDVARGVAQAYFTVLGATGLTIAAGHSIEAAADNLKIVEDRVSVGVGTELDLSRAQANLERARQDQADADLAVSLSARRLETLSGLTPAPAVEFAGGDLLPEPPLAEFLVHLGQTPRERAAQEATEAAVRSRKSADAVFVPTVSAVGQERFTNATGFSGQGASYIVQLTAAVRLDYASLANGRAQAAALDAQRVRAERLRRDVSDAIFEAYRRVEAGIVKARAARAEGAASKRAADLSGERYLAGAATQLDVTQAQRELFLAEASRIQADADLAYARAALRLSAGMPITRRGAK